MANDSTQDVWIIAHNDGNGWIPREGEYESYDAAALAKRAIYEPGAHGRTYEIMLRDNLASRNRDFARGE